MLAFKYPKHIYFLGCSITPAAPALLLWMLKLPLNVIGADEYYNVCTHQAKLSKCFEEMDYLRPGQTCDIRIIPILRWRGDHCPRSGRKARAELGGPWLPLSHLTSTLLWYRGLPVSFTHSICFCSFFFWTKWTCESHLQCINNINTRSVLIGTDEQNVSKTWLYLANFILDLRFLLGISQKILILLKQ